LITPEQIDEWIHEAEERPFSAGIIIRYIGMRLKDLTGRNEELLSENIALRSGRKVEEYEGRISNLEYQVDLLKRQLSGISVEGQVAAPAAETISLIVYNTKGQVLRFDLSPDALEHCKTIARLKPSAGLGDVVPRLLVTGEQDELLNVFDSGRSETLPVSAVSSVEPDGMEWHEGTRIEARANESLVTILPIGRMALYECVVQISRRGCARKIMRSSFEQHLAKNYVGTGVRALPDKSFGLSFSAREDRLVLVTREGWLASVGVDALPYTAEEVLKLSATDYLVAGFVVGKKPSIVMLTQNGKAIHREASWLEPVESFKSRGQAVFSASRREAGARVAGAAAVDERDWALALLEDGRIVAYQVSELLSSGSLFGEKDGGEVLDFFSFSLPARKKLE
jgi:DNA gyrase/topoisomerase IV subunit A